MRNFCMGTSGGGVLTEAHPRLTRKCALYLSPRINHVMNFISDSQEAQNGPVYGLGSIFPASTHVLGQGVRSFHDALQTRQDRRGKLRVW